MDLERARHIVLSEIIKDYLSFDFEHGTVMVDADHLTAEQLEAIAVILKHKDAIGPEEIEVYEKNEIGQSTRRPPCSS